VKKRIFLRFNFILGTAIFAASYLTGTVARSSVLVPANDPHIQYFGRFDFSDPLAPRFDWPAVSISAVFQGTSVGILLDDGNNDFDAFIDGKLQQVIVTDDAAQYTVGGLKPGTHSLLLVKRTEASFGIVVFKGLILENGMSLLKPPSPPSRRIEFVGDSLACGAEVEDMNASCEPSHFRPTANGYLAFGPLAARALNADYRVTSYSGTGILAKFGVVKMTMPAYYPRVLAGLDDQVIDPHQWAPDAVVIELGGNDFFSGGTPPSQDEFESAYRKFIAVLRADYPKAQIFCATFGTLPPAGNLIQDVVEQEKKAGDDKVGLIVLDYPKAHLTGCYKHFDLVGQQQVGDELAKALREILGWEE
jgi:lysophospholipase L1-like esterase